MIACSFAQSLPPPLGEKKPRPQQGKAIDDVISGFTSHDAGKLIMACGTSKTSYSSLPPSPFINGRYKATAKELNGKPNKRREGEFNERVSPVYQSIPNLDVRLRERKIEEMPFGSMGEHYDIDVLVADPKRRRLEVVECNDPASGSVGVQPSSLSGTVQVLSLRYLRGAWTHLSLEGQAFEVSS